MPLRTHHRLFLSYAALVAAVVALLALGVDATLRGPLLERARADLARELALGRELSDTAPEADPNSLARRIASVTGHRVTIISPDGQVLGDSDVPREQLPELDDHSDRPEVQEALRTGFGSSVRWSASVGAELLYAATPTARGDIIRFAVGIAQIDAAVAAVRRQVLIVGGIALLLAALFSLGFSFVMTRPLRRMQRTASAMAEGNLSARVRPSRSDELGDLGHALDHLASELERRLGQLEGERAEMNALVDSMTEGVIALGEDGSVRRANPAARAIFGLPLDALGLPPEAVARRAPFLELVSRVLRGESVSATELTHDGRHLLATAQPLAQGGAVLVFLDTSELHRLEGVRRDFVANASHELKTPLTAIRGYSETLLQNDLPDDARQRFTERLHANVTRLQRILEGLLDLSKIESGGWVLEPVHVSLDDLVRGAWQPFEEEAARARVELATDIAPESDDLEADANGLRVVLSNLFSNALRYTPPSGTIRVHARRDGEAVAIEVTDTGSGIGPEHLPRIFERFYRVDPARSRAEGGTGLGLAIVRHIVERHGGRVEAESEVGKGTTIRFVLPRVVSAE